MLKLKGNKALFTLTNITILALFSFFSVSAASINFSSSPFINSDSLIRKPKLVFTDRLAGEIKSIDELLVDLKEKPEPKPKPAQEEPEEPEVIAANPQNDPQPNPAQPVQSEQFNETTPDPAPQPSIPSHPYINIPKIGLNYTAVGYASMQNMPDMDAKLLQGPVVESQLTADLCTTGKNAYLMGHSEPAVASTSGYPGVRIFSNLTALQPGDLIQARGANGIECTYRVTNWDQTVTQPNGQTTWAEFNRLLYPANQNQSTLTIQTCQKGSATVKLILRAVRV
jgi:sortase (surface protein transpeptidase)